MADTLPVVVWSLERACPLRGGKDWCSPVVTSNQLSEVGEYQHARKWGQLSQGHRVTRYADWYVDLKTCVSVPTHGISVEQAFRHCGGILGVERACANCEANATTDRDDSWAGCHGFVCVAREDPDIDSELWDAIVRRGLRRRVKEAFQITKPLWYGLWIHSPLLAEACDLLRELLSAAPKIAIQDRDGAAHLERALCAAVEHHLPLHVQMGTAGHTDGGIHTTFPHCPRCKAEAETPRWVQEYPREPYRCDVCGWVYLLNETGSSSEDDDECGADLDRSMGTKQYLEFVRAYLRDRGESNARIEAAIANRHRPPYPFPEF